MSRTTHQLCEHCMEICLREGKIAAHVVREELAGRALCCGCWQRRGVKDLTATVYIFHLPECDFLACRGFHEGEDPAPPPTVVRS